jgi:hypothetical protein
MLTARPGAARYLFGVASLVLFSLLLLLLTWEGMACLAMAAPLGLVTTMVGVFVGHGLRGERGVKPRHSMLALSFSMPLALIDSAHMPKEPLLHRVTSELHVAAPPSVVWIHVVSFSDLPPPQNWIFRYGLAYPMRARIEGEGIGAIRHCEFSTGAFVEPITVWDAPRHLAFSVTESPSPMRETNPFGEVAAPHLNGYFASRQGEVLRHVAHLSIADSSDLARQIDSR